MRGKLSQGLVGIAIAVLVVVGVSMRDAAATPADISVTDVLDLASFLPIPGASATLVRSAGGIRLMVNTSGLEPGTPVTVWWVVWNNPENCARVSAPFCTDTDDFANEFDGDPTNDVNVTFIRAAGTLVGGNGGLSIAGHLRLDDASESINALFGFPFDGGLVDPFAAEIHFLVRIHPSDLDPGILDDAIHSFDGGCPDDGTFTFPGCEDVQAGIFLP